MSLRLSRTEIRDLTGTPQRVRQVRFLVDNGIRHYLDAHGWPVVLRSTIEHTHSAAEPVTDWKPNKAA